MELLHTSETINSVEIYLAEDCDTMDRDPLMFWKVNEQRFPGLSKLALKYLCTPVSSAPVERLFSIAGKVFKPERCSLSDQTFHDLMMIKCNNDI